MKLPHVGRVFSTVDGLNDEDFVHPKVKKSLALSFFGFVDEENSCDLFVCPGKCAKIGMDNGQGSC